MLRCRLHTLFSPLFPLLCAALVGCAAPRADVLAPRVDALLPADAILFGEQHDAPDHHRLERDLTALLAQRHELAALLLEMAPAGAGTGGLPRDAPEARVRTALQWDEAAWPWRDYAPAVMAAVRAGVPVRGANLPRAAMREAMQDAALDTLLPPQALAAQREAIRIGHCGLLPPDQIAPMTRIQIARDREIARTVAQAAAAAPAGRAVLLIAGAGHVDKTLGVPRHLPPDFKEKVVIAKAQHGEFAINLVAQDALWPATPAPPRDYCADLRAPSRLPPQG